MRSEIKKLDATTIELVVETSEEVVKDKFEEVFGKISSQAKIKGFRPGHAPRHLVEKEYSNFAYEKVAEELIPQILEQVYQQHNLHVVTLLEVKDVKLDRNHISFRAKVEIAPQIELKNYKGIPLTYKKIAVTVEEVKRSIDFLKESRKAEIIDDNFARSLGYPTLAELEEALKIQLAAQKEHKQREDLQEQVFDFLTKSVKVALPQSLVNKHLQKRLRQVKLDLALKGVDAEEIEKNTEEIKKRLLPEVQDEVKVYLVLAEIAKREKIPMDEQLTQRGLEFLWKNAQWKIE
ncbi:MAG: trigger factor [Candidatus Omnitrophica bacterium]|nr:trigger factor [Candidatus Omnitrophota bacterium]